MEKKIRPIRLGKIIVAAIVILLFIYFLPIPLGGDSEVMIVRGQSMLPTILPGSIVITKAAPSYHVDDIVSYNLVEKLEGLGFGGGSIERIVVHRIIEETEEGFLIKGDNNRNVDAGFYSEDQIRGKVFFVIPYAGDVFELLRNPGVLIFTAISTFLIQAEQKRRKKRKEKLRRIMLGLPPGSSNIKETELVKQKKPSYSVFYAALGLNIVIYVIVQISIVNDWLPLRDMGDMLTGFLFKMFASSFASTLAFSLYFIYIFGVYFFARVYSVRDKKTKRRSKLRKLKPLGEMILGKNFNLVISLAQTLWILYILVSAFHLLAMSQSLINSVTDTCDPTTEIC